MAESTSNGERRRLDKGTLLGLVVAVAGILGGLVLEQGAVSDISQGTAALIVFGGTFGAVLIGTPLHLVLQAMRALRWVVFEHSYALPAMVDELVAFATKARRQGIISLEAESQFISDPFLKKAVDLAIDGLDSAELRDMMSLDQHAEEQRMINLAKVYETAGGYAPTIGIIGAVLGLIQVMKNLANIEEVGHGIAVAFVATIYGVGSANLLFLPAAAKIRNHVHLRMEAMDLVIEGVTSIVEGMNPRLLRRKLESVAAGSAGVNAAYEVSTETAGDRVS